MHKNILWPVVTWLRITYLYWILEVVSNSITSYDQNKCLKITLMILRYLSFGKKVDLSDTAHDFVLDRSFVYSLHFLNRSLKCKWMLKSWIWF